MKTKEPRTNSDERAGGLERFALGAAVLGGIVLLVGVTCITVGAVFQPAGAGLAWLLSDDALVPIIIISSLAHLLFVPAFCVIVACRDARRERAGVPLAPPSSVWSGHASVFEELDDVAKAA